MEALNIIIKGIEQIAHDIAPNNYNIKTVEDDDIKNLLRFFKSKNKKIVYGLIGKTFREYET